jgi:phenylpropionate dioxygenase-like ring-hydroxylating dioxygenase large terminal subunit
MHPGEIEMLRQLWLPVARAQDLESERPIGVSVLGQRVVVFRGENGVTAAIDRCPHRGAQLSLGRTQDGVLECPYHGWRWDEAGRCCLVPSQPDLRSNARLDVLPVAEKFGLVWVSLVEPHNDLPSIPEIETDPGGGWEFEHGDWFDVSCGLRSITENFRDSSHFAFVHRETFADVNPAIPAYTVKAEGFRLGWEITLTFGAAWSVRNGDGAAPKYRFGASTGDGQAEGDEQLLLHYRFELPALAYVYTEHDEGAKRLVCQAAAPIDAEGHRCRVFFFVAADATFRRTQGPLSTQVEIEHRVFHEDVRIVESLDPTEAPLDLDGQTHVRADRYSVAYRKLYREMLQASQSWPKLRLPLGGPRS